MRVLESSEYDKIYPVVFSRKIKSTLWGGKKLYGEFESHNASALNKKIGELWNLCENHSIIALNGSYRLLTLDELLNFLPDKFYGTKYSEYFKNSGHYPLILKIIDACDKLSIQLHPDEKMAMELEKYYSGKTEIWYVLDAVPGSEIILGFSNKIDGDTFRRLIGNDSLEKVLNHIKVNKGDVFFIPPGCVHAIGSGILIAEVQQNCDITYRVYDYARTDYDGQRRQLHVEKAIKCVDFNFLNPGRSVFKTFEKKGVKISHINSNDYFDVFLYDAEPIYEYGHSIPLYSSFINLGGDLNIFYANNKSVLLNKYSAFLMPAFVRRRKIRKPKRKGHISSSGRHRASGRR